MKIGVDLDDTLGYTRPELIKFHNDTYGTNLTMKDIVSYDLWKVWGGTRDEAVQKIEDFHKTEYFKRIKPVEDARAVLEKLKKNNELYVITGRRNNVKKETEEWIGKNFPNIFSKIYLSNQFSSDEATTTKKNVCNELGIDIFIEDDLANALECAESEARKVYLFDYPWNQCDKLPKNMKRVYSWKEILEDIEKN